MNNFQLYNPVRLAFGKGQISNMGKMLPKGARILITYGGGSIKRNGVYDAVVEQLKGFEYFEFGGIEPNPHFETLMKAVELIKKEKLEFILAVGGGSVIDGSKFVALAAHFEGNDPWDILSKSAPIKSAVPLGAVLTLAATGSEMNGNFVVTKAETREKLARGSELVYPVFSILDPEYTYTLPKRQVANGIIDSYVHTMEQYLTYKNGADLQDSLAEGILRSLIAEGPKAMQADEPAYENREKLMWAATLALNGLLSCGTIGDWATHMIGHELTALHGLDHAVTLAIVMPGVLDFTMKKRKEKLLQCASTVWNITDGDDESRCKQAIQKTEEFFNALGVKTRLGDYGIMEDTIDEILKRFRSRGFEFIGGAGDIRAEDVEEILKSRL